MLDAPYGPGLLGREVRRAGPTYLGGRPGPRNERIREREPGGAGRVWAPHGPCCLHLVFPVTQKNIGFGR